jgi:hypothetical protein
MEDDKPAVVVECDSCSFIVGSRILFFLLLDSQVISMLSYVGIDVKQYEWELPESTACIVSREPLRIRVEIEAEGEEVTLVVDESLDVCSVDASC